MSTITTETLLFKHKKPRDKVITALANLMVSRTKSHNLDNPEMREQIPMFNSATAWVDYLRANSGYVILAYLNSKLVGYVHVQLDTQYVGCSIATSWNFNLAHKSAENLALLISVAKVVAVKQHRSQYLLLESKPRDSLKVLRSQSVYMHTAYLLTSKLTATPPEVDVVLTTLTKEHPAVAIENRKTLSDLEDLFYKDQARQAEPLKFPAGGLKLNAKQWVASMFADGSVYILLEMEAVTVGFVQVRPLDNYKAWQIEALFVLPEFRRKGLAIRLIVAAFDHIKDLPMVDGALISWYGGNTASNNLYRKLGFNDLTQKHLRKW